MHLTLALNERWKAPNRFRRVDAVMSPFPSTSKKSKAALISASQTSIPPREFFGTCNVVPANVFAWCLQ